MNSRINQISNNYTPIRFIIEIKEIATTIYHISKNPMIKLQLSYQQPRISSQFPQEGVQKDMEWMVRELGIGVITTNNMIKINK